MTVCVLFVSLNWAEFWTDIGPSYFVCQVVRYLGDSCSLDLCKYKTNKIM